MHRENSRTQHGSAWIEAAAHGMEVARPSANRQSISATDFEYDAASPQPDRRASRSEDD